VGLSPPLGKWSSHLTERIKAKLCSQWCMSCIVSVITSIAKVMQSLKWKVNKRLKHLPCKPATLLRCRRQNRDKKRTRGSLVIMATRGRSIVMGFFSLLVKRAPSAWLKFFVSLDWFHWASLALRSLHNLMLFTHSNQGVGIGIVPLYFEILKVKIINLFVLQCKNP
jgi:hypothetical protein